MDNKKLTEIFASKVFPIKLPGIPKPFIEFKLSECYFGFKEYFTEKFAELNFNYKEEYLVGAIFSKRQLSLPYRSPQSIKSELQLANIFFQTLTTKIDAIDPVEEGISMYCEHLWEFLVDIKNVLHVFYFLKKKEFNLDIGWTSKKITAFEVYNVSKKVLFKDSALKLNIRHSKNISTFLIRQAVETKLKSVFGLETIYDSRGQSPKIGIKFFTDFIKKYQSSFSLTGIDFRNILKIVEWSNYSIHNSIVPKMWEINYAFSVLDKLFESQRQVDKNGDIFSFDLFGGFKINDFEKVRQALLNEINEKINSFKDEPKLYCIELSDFRESK